MFLKCWLAFLLGTERFLILCRAFVKKSNRFCAEGQGNDAVSSHVQRSAGIQVEHHVGPTPPAGADAGWPARAPHLQSIAGRLQPPSPARGAKSELRSIEV